MVFKEIILVVFTALKEIQISTADTKPDSACHRPSPEGKPKRLSRGEKHSSPDLGLEETNRGGEEEQPYGCIVLLTQYTEAQ